MKKRLQVLAAVAAAAVLAGCGYTLVGQASNIPEDVRRVYLGERFSL